ncbi:MAG: YdcF family protein [Micavibrio sp.]|nr:YdcF family protein [Micavibrio sp.]
MRLILQLFVFLFVFIPCTWLFGLGGFAGGVLLIKPEKPTMHSDAIIVLTGGKDRIETGLDLFAEELAPELFITGVHDDVTQAEILARYTGAKPLPECCMVLGYKANSTTENASETKEWMAGKNIKTIRLVTANYHMPRAVLEFRAALPGVKIITHPISQPDIAPGDKKFWHIIFEEYHKTVFRFFEILTASLR